MSEEDMKTDMVPMTESSMMIMPAYTIAQALQRRNDLNAFVSAIMVSGTDYGEIPGTGRDGKKGKDTLLKPGAEKLVSFFGLAPRFTLERDEDWTGERHNGEAFLGYVSKCQLYHRDRLIGEGTGSCSSWESKYRYRNAERKCPNCGEPAIKKSKFPPKGSLNAQPGFYCYAKVNGCGAEFAANDERIVNQEVGKVANPDIADLQNTCIKMSDKRALVAACLIGVNASEFFTQDVEDMPQYAAPADVVDAEYRDSPTRAAGGDIERKQQEIHKLLQAMPDDTYEKVRAWAEEEFGQVDPFTRSTTRDLDDYLVKAREFSPQSIRDAGQQATAARAGA